MIWGELSKFLRPLKCKAALPAEFPIAKFSQSQEPLVDGAVDLWWDLTDIATLTSGCERFGGSDFVETHLVPLGDTNEMKFDTTAVLASRKWFDFRRGIALYFGLISVNDVVIEGKFEPSFMKNDVDENTTQFKCQKFYPGFTPQWEPEKKKKDKGKETADNEAAAVEPVSRNQLTKNGVPQWKRTFKKQTKGREIDILLTKLSCFELLPYVSKLFKDNAVPQLTLFVDPMWGVNTSKTPESGGSFDFPEHAWKM